MKTAFVTCADYNFKPGLNKLHSSLHKHNDMSGIDKILISDEIDEFKDYEVISPGEAFEEIPIKNPRFKKSFYKLLCFSLTEYDRVIFIDADILCLADISNLFALTDFAAAADDGIRLNNVYKENFKRFNSGVMVINKSLLSLSVYNEMIDYAMSGQSYDSGDQGVINEFMYKHNIKIHYLPMEYNTLKRVYFHHKPIWNKIKNNIKLLHYVGHKPWNRYTVDDIKYKELNQLWWRS